MLHIACPCILLVPWLSGESQKPGDEVVRRPGKRAIDDVRVTLFVYNCACFSAWSSLLLGYDIGIMSSAILFIRPDLNLSTVQAEACWSTNVKCG